MLSSKALDEQNCISTRASTGILLLEPNYSNALCIKSPSIFLPVATCGYEFVDHVGVVRGRSNAQKATTQGSRKGANDHKKCG